MPAFTAHLLVNGKAYQSGGKNSRNLRFWQDPASSLPELVHRGQELLVGLRQLELVQQELHALHGIQLREDFPEEPDLRELVLLQQELFLPGPGLKSSCWRRTSSRRSGSSGKSSRS